MLLATNFEMNRDRNSKHVSTVVFQIEGQGLPPAALELTKLEKDAFLQVLLHNIAMENVTI